MHHHLATNFSLLSVDWPPWHLLCTRPAYDALGMIPWLLCTCFPERRVSCSRSSRFGGSSPCRFDHSRFQDTTTVWSMGSNGCQ